MQWHEEAGQLGYHCALPRCARYRSKPVRTARGHGAVCPWTCLLPAPSECDPEPRWLPHTTSPQKRPPWSPEMTMCITLCYRERKWWRKKYLILCVCARYGWGAICDNYSTIVLYATVYPQSFSTVANNYTMMRLKQKGLYNTFFCSIYRLKSSYPALSILLKYEVKSKQRTEELKPWLQVFCKMIHTMISYFLYCISTTSCIS